MQKIRNIEALRFIFAVIIVYFHIFHSNLISLYENSSQLHILSDKCCSASYIVELFFIISGFFLYRTFDKHKNSTVFEFATGKFFRLWPVLAFSILCSYILHIFGLININGYNNFFNLLLCQCNGISLQYEGINWYVSSCFWALLFYFTLLKNCKANIANWIIALITYFSYVGIVNIGFGRIVIYSFISLGILRGLAGIGLGYLVGLFIDNLNRVQLNLKIHTKINYIAISIVEIYCLTFLIQNFVFHQINCNNPMIFIFVFVILFILMIYEKGLLSKILDNKISVFLGRYSYSIYVMQQTAFWIMQNSIWKNRSLILNHLTMCIIISLLFSILLGVIVYHLIEKPFVDFYKKQINYIS
ncbi:MAG: acyltransferase [Cyanobacteriota bacterium]|nr:acyltransferase [Cyanobacteriota bacterium]